MALTGHEERFPPPRLSDRYGFSKETVARVPGSDRDAPIPDLPTPPRNGEVRPTADIRAGFLHRLSLRKVAPRCRPEFLIFDFCTQRFLLSFVVPKSLSRAGRAGMGVGIVGVTTSPGASRLQRFFGHAIQRSVVTASRRYLMWLSLNLRLRARLLGTVYT
jgi:hypothetical protein